jgi:hypothetical protein
MEFELWSAMCLKPWWGDEEGCCWLRGAPMSFSAGQTTNGTPNTKWEGIRGEVPWEE